MTVGVPLVAKKDLSGDEGQLKFHEIFGLSNISLKTTQFNSLSTP